MRRWLALLVFFGTTVAGAAVPASRSVTLVGQVVCAECWGEADRTKVPYGDDADLACADRCAKKGISRALAVRSTSGWILYHLAPGSFDPGPNPFLAQIARQARITGQIHTTGGRHYLMVESLELLDDRTTGRPTGVSSPPELELTNLHGAPQRLSQLRGQIVVLNFWATFCPPCLREMPMLTKLQAEYGPRGVQVIGAANEPLDKRWEVGQVAKSKQANFPIWIGASTGQMERFGLPPALPGTALIGRDGVVQQRITGELSESTLRQHLDRMLALEAAGAPAR